MQPFKVRLTGSGSGTLPAVIVQAELVHRVESCPQPAWWVNAEDLAGLPGVSDGQDIPDDTIWPDRIADRDMAYGGSESNPDMAYVADAINGKPGIRGTGNSSQNRSWQWDTTVFPATSPLDYSDGITQAVVWVDPDGGCSFIAGTDGTTGFELYFSTWLQQWYADPVGGTTAPYLEGDDSRVDNRPVAAVVRADRSQTGLRWNGAEWVDDSGLGVVEVGEGDWWDQANLSGDFIELKSFTEDGIICEAMIWDRALSNEELACWEQYFVDRYAVSGPS